nr:THAP domain-containing protein 8 [Neomonachus schauinslandi]
MRHKGPSRESGGERRGPKYDCRLGRTQWGRTAMHKYCRAPNCSNTSGRLGADNRPVSFYNMQLPCKMAAKCPSHHHLVPTEPAQGHGIRDWLRHMGHEDWVPSCRQHLCSEHFTPSCFQWRRAVRYLRPDAVLSIFSPAPPAKPGVWAQHPLARLGTVLGALQRRVRRLQRRQEQPQGQLRAVEQLGQQVCKEGLPPRGTGACRACSLDLRSPIICGGPDIAVVIAQSPAPPTLDAKPELLDTETPSA